MIGFVFTGQGGDGLRNRHQVYLIVVDVRQDNLSKQICCFIVD